MKKIKFSKKAAALAIAGVMLTGGVGGGTLAWLVDNTDPLTNTFTKSDITVDIEETKGSGVSKNEFQMIPGFVIDKDPVAWVSTDSENCYLFVKVEETIGEIKIDDTTYGFDDFIKYKIDVQWTKVPNVENVYYKKIDGTDGHKKNEKYNILGNDSYDNGTPTDTSDDFTWEDNQVFVLPTVTKEMMNKITDANRPRLSFTAYAVQLMKSNDVEFTPEEAWKQVKTN